MMHTCKQLKLRQTSSFECSCAVRSFGGVFVSLHVADAISGPAPRGKAVIKPCFKHNVVAFIFPLF